MTTQMQVRLPRNYFDSLLKHAKENEPNESCAILLGQKDDNQFLIRDIFPTKNTEKSPVNFTISSNDLIEAYKYAERNNLEVIAIFHSHPISNAYPSLTDRKYMEINPVPWLIYSNHTNELRAFILESDLISIPIITI